MEIPQITSALSSFVREQFGIPEDDLEFTDQVDLFNYGYIDSFGAVALTSFIEKRFSIRLSATDWSTFPLSTLTEMSVFISRRLKGEI